MHRYIILLSRIYFRGPVLASESIVTYSTPTNSHWARVVSYGLVYLCVIHKEGLCPSSGDINRLMMMKKLFFCVYSTCDRKLLFLCVVPNATQNNPFKTGCRDHGQIPDDTKKKKKYSKHSHSRLSSPK
jgi:hypothetical protein